MWGKEGAGAVRVAGEWLAKSALGGGGCGLGMRGGRLGALYFWAMRILPDSSLWGWTESGGNGIAGEKTVEEQMKAVDTRAEFAREYVARGGRVGNGERLDPVLAAHLGLGEREVAGDRGAKIGQCRSFRKGGENPGLSPFCACVKGKKSGIFLIRSGGS